MHCLLVVAHPLEQSLCATLAETARAALAASGHQVEVLDLYHQNFHPALTPAERESYYQRFDQSALSSEIAQLQRAEILVLVFPTWWFGFPAILKGWFDRVWAPGVAYDHAADLGTITPRLVSLKHALAITTLGSPCWVDKCVMWQPVRRILKTAILKFCAPGCRLEFLSFYKCENLSAEQVQKMTGRVAAAAARFGRSANE